MKILFITILTVLLASFSAVKSFLAEQRRFDRVRTAIHDKGSVVAAELKKHDLLPDNINILIVAYKEEGILDLYAKNKSANTYKKIRSYEICSRSGQPGPKRRYGDGQVPEGFYHIERFNPTSTYYLSLGLNYPNQSDRIKSTAEDPGGDIFIHGYCVTIGCLPMTNDKIKEIYLYSVYAKNNGQNNIPVYIFPFKMSDENIQHHEKKFRNYPSLLTFWQNLETGHKLFQKKNTALNISVAKNGDYIFNE
jgi:murein L,D-transpeptidase YafK